VEYHIARYFPCLDSEVEFLKYLKRSTDANMICYMRFDFKASESYIVLVTMKTFGYSMLASEFTTILKTLLHDDVTDAVLADLEAAIFAAHPDGSATETTSEPKTVDLDDMIAKNESTLATL
jgi:hypothetical protein